MMDLELDYLNHTRLKILLYLVNNPEGKQKSEIANALPISRNDSLKIQKDLFEEHLIEAKLDFTKHRFSLSPDGIKVMYMLKAMDIYMKKAIKPEYFASNEELAVFGELAKITDEFVQKQQALRTAKKVEQL